jgi:ribosomal protein L24E
MKTVTDLHVKSSRNTLYFSLSACSSNTTNNRLPVKLFAWTTTDHKKATVKESNHLILR